MPVEGRPDGLSTTTRTILRWIVGPARWRPSSLLQVPCPAYDYTVICSLLDMPKGLGRGYFFQGTPLTPEPADPRAVAFIDGQNLFHTAICKAKAWRVIEVRFYTGIPDSRNNPQWHRLLSRKLGVMGRERVHIFARPLRYRARTIHLRDGSIRSFLSGEEKGIDVRLALDAVRMAHRRAYDVALILSQDQDLSEVAEEIRSIAREQRRWIKIPSAFPSTPSAPNPHGIDRTD